MKRQSRQGLKRFWLVLSLFLGIFWAFYSLKIKRLWHKEAWIEAKKQELDRSQARIFKDTAVGLGGLLIKLGQFFSTRVDILPPASIEELSTLQDEVRPVLFDQLRDLAEKEFSNPLETVFAFVDQNPLASASLGQVHLARLHDGQTVAVKIQRPGIENLVVIDLKAIGRVVSLLKTFTDWERFIDLDAIYQEFAETLQAELDYVQEGHNAETIAENSREDSDLIIPTILWPYSTRRVLTMEYVEGIKITDLTAIEEAGIDRSTVASRLLQIYIKQVLIDGFYHADPHPGNLFVKPDGKIVMVDFGMVGHIPAELRDTLIEMVFSMVNRDFEKVVDSLTRIGFIRAGSDRELLGRAVSLFLEQTLGKAKDFSSNDLHLILEDLEKLLYENPFQVPANFTFLGRALGTLYGICIKLSPGISFLDVARPYVDQIAPEKEGMWKIIQEKGKALGLSLVELPTLAEKVLRRAERGDLEVKVPLPGLMGEIESNTRAIRSLTWAVVFGFTLFTSAYLEVNQRSNMARWGLSFAVLSLLGMFLSYRRTGSRRLPRHPGVIPRRKQRKAGQR
ncbi:MAG TPA: AarF/UbiB family protein [Syntrophomonadaceae bacterium]|nr:AarF/UbiB family protein [Syntrophomonadaceae bacterium]